MDPEEAPIAAQTNEREAAPKRKPSHRKRNICIGISASIMAIVILIVILALTVFKAKDPKITLNSISVKNLSLALDMARLRANLNVSLDVSMGIKNPNKFSFKMKNGSNAEIRYRGDTVGVLPVPASKMSADKTTAVNMTATLLADRLLSNSQFLGDVVAGSLPMSTKAKVSGKVSILGIKITVSSTSTCHFTLFVGNRTISDEDCKTKTKTKTNL